MNKSISHKTVLSDRQLFTLISNGSEHAFRLIFERYRTRMWSFVMTLVKSPYAAEEVVQDSFIKLWEYRDLLANVQRPDDFIFILMRNHSLNYLRKLTAEQKGKTELWALMNQQPAHFDRALELREAEKIWVQIVAQLPAQQQKILRLSREEGLSHQEIADHLNISKNTVKNHLIAALKTCRALWSRLYLF